MYPLRVTHLRTIYLGGVPEYSGHCEEDAC